jgi:hypothetical protein
MLAPEFALLTARLVGETDVILAGAQRGGELTAALPMARGGRKLRALRSEHSPRVDFLGEPSSLPALWRALRQAGGFLSSLATNVAGSAFAKRGARLTSRSPTSSSGSTVASAATCGDWSDRWGA